MIEIMKKILTNVLESLYQSFGFSVVLAVLFMFLYMYVKEKGWKEAIQSWLRCFKASSKFRRVLVLALYTGMILFRTLLNRNMWANPLDNVIGIWGLYNLNGDLTTEVIENLVLFIPFTVLLLWSFEEKIVGLKNKFSQIVVKSTMSVFAFSALIEFSQLFFRLGTFQLSDLFYNTLSGLMGGLIYWCGYKLTHRNKKEQ